MREKIVRVPHNLDGVFHEDRFWDKVDMRGTDECWIFKGKSRSHGYANVRWLSPQGRATMCRAHIVAYRLCYGNQVIVRGQDVCHRCDVRDCVNPAHLFLGTRKQNMEDAIKKKRMARGERAGPSRIKDKDIPTIIRLRKAGLYQKTIGLIFGVHGTAICRVLNGERKGGY